MIYIAVPIFIAIFWKKKKHEHITSVLAGPFTFLLFALILEKNIQNVLLFPTSMGLKNHALSTFMNSHPIFLSFLAGLFPGLFEESGRFAAFKTLLKKRKNPETSISYGIGHGGFEIIFILGITYMQYIVYSFMINKGIFENVVNQVKSVAPAQVAAVYKLKTKLLNFSFPTLAIDLIERIFAFLFHIGASILVFYSCNEKNKFFLYPLAIILHTLMDFIGVLFQMALEIIIPRNLNRGMKSFRMELF